MGAGKVILWRHGQTDYNAAGRVQGQIDIALSPVGMAQCEAAAKVLSQDCTITKIVSSPLSRAVDTAGALSALLHIPVNTDDRLMERSFGRFEGLTRQQMEDEYPQWFQQWQTTGECVAAGIENSQDMAHRAATAINEAVADVASEETVVIVSHGSALSRGICALLGLPGVTTGWLKGLNNCHWSVLERGRQIPWRLVAHNLSATPGDSSLPSMA